MLKRTLAFLLAGILLLGCTACKEPADEKGTESLLETAEVSMNEGHFFFIGKVLSVVNEKKMITFYDAAIEKNTFYRVEITDDLFGCLPERVITVCVYGTGASFKNRKSLEKGKEYFFDTQLWADAQEPVFLLPTFYSGMPERQGEHLLLNEPEGTFDLGRPDDYREELLALANRVGYGAKTVMTGMKRQLELAIQNSNKAHFDALDVKDTDEAFLAEVTATARRLSEKADAADETWNGIRGVLE